MELNRDSTTDAPTHAGERGHPLAGERDHPLAVEPIDYVARWRQLVRAREDQGRRFDPQHGRSDHWAGDRAERFRRMTLAARAGAPDPLFELIRPWLTPETTVLDVGAGTGRHALTVAPLVRKVIAVEPSPAMREQLEIGRREAGLTNVEVVAAAWPTADVPPADLVICSHVLYFVAEVEPFLRRLREVTRRRAYVVHRHQQRELLILDLFERIWGEPRSPEPSFTDLFGVASQLQLWANVTTIPFTVNLGFASLDEAVPMVRADLLNPSGDGIDEVIRAYLRERLTERDGRWVSTLPVMAAGVLWWEEAR